MPRKPNETRRKRCTWMKTFQCGLVDGTNILQQQALVSTSGRKLV
ncbi:MAG: hypothetical protein ACLPN1_09155 [Dissulfurispiraceae bacterium]